MTCAVLYLEISSRGGGKIKVSRNRGGGGGGKPSWMPPCATPPKCTPACVYTSIYMSSITYDMII